MKVSVLIAAYNEKNTIQEIVERIFEVDFTGEIIITDDASTDGTREKLQELARRHPPEKLRVHFHDKNQGKGAAIRTCLADAKGDIALIQDADLEYDPRDYPKLLQPILEGKADAVYGSRFLGGPHRVLFFWHYCANRFLTLLSNMLTNLNLTDMETCYKVFRTSLVKGLTLRENRFGFEPEVTTKIARKRARIFEVPISYYGRDYSEGKKIGWKDGIAAIFVIFRYRFFD